MLTTDELKLITEVQKILDKDDILKEDLDQARTLMSSWPESMTEIKEDFEESIYLIEADRNR